MDNKQQPLEESGKKESSFAMWFLVGAMVVAFLILAYMFMFGK